MKKIINRFLKSSLLVTLLFGSFYISSIAKAAVPESKDPIKVLKNAIKKSKELKSNVIILDTAGRLHIDKELIKKQRKFEPGRQLEKLASSLRYGGKKLVKSLSSKASFTK